MIMVKDETRKIVFYKEKAGDKIWWVDYVSCRGIYAVSFDKKKILFLFGDYPKNFTLKRKRNYLTKKILIGQTFFRKKDSPRRVWESILTELGECEKPVNFAIVIPHFDALPFPASTGNLLYFNQ